jgi:hypothetical protein
MLLWFVSVVPKHLNFATFSNDSVFDDVDVNGGWYNDLK